MLKRNTNKIQAFCFVIALMLSVVGLSSFSAVDGTEIGNELCQLMSVSDWYDLDDIRNDLGGDYVLMNDLDENSPGYGDLVATVDGWDPIGDYDLEEDVEFTGTFDGNGYEIRDLYINRSGEDDVGLFGCLGTGGLVTNVRLIDADVTGNDQVGALVGRNRPGTVDNSFASAYVNGHFRVGVLVGDNHEGTIYNSHSSGAVIGMRNVGGLVGLSWNQGIVERSSSTASVFAGEYYAGGLMGQNRAEVHHSFATGDVNCTSWSGGLVGYNYKFGLNLGLISNCYATGNVNGFRRIGGLVGEHIGDVINSYSTGEVVGSELVGGLIGDDDEGAGNAENSFWNVETSGQATSNGGTGKTFAEMMDVATYTDLTSEGLDEPWDFVGNPNDDTGLEDIWNIDENFNRGYPFLSWESTLIYDWYDLDNIRNDLDGSYVLMNNLDTGSDGYADLVGTVDGWDPIGDDITGFSGSFDGNGYRIYDLSINRPGVSFVGLFGYTAIGSNIENVNLLNVDIIGGTRVGGLVGYNNGFVSDSSASGTVTADGWYTGVLVGYNYDPGTIAGSHSFGNAVGVNGVGGLVGINRGSIINSYSTSDADGNNYVGGLVAEHRGNVRKCYSTGVPTGNDFVGGLVGWSNGVVEDSFWDTQTSGTDSSAGGTGKTTAQMKNVATFTDVSTDGLEEPWDFVGNPYDDQGDEDIWDMDERINEGYPFLTWEPMAVYDWYDLHAVRNDLGGNYVLMNDIDENSPGYDEIVGTPLGFKPIGDLQESFTGTLEGNGKEIGDLFINRTDENYVGLFGRIEDATIVNLMVSGSVTGRQWVGGLVGFSRSGTTLISHTVSNVDVTNVDASVLDRVGGLVGILHNGNRIRNSAAHGTITGPSGAILGGLVGSIYHADVIIETSYSTGLVNEGLPGTNVGGLVGFKHADAQVIDSYWDTLTTEQDVSAGGIPLETNEMTGGRATAAGAMEGFDFYDTWYITEMYPELAVHYDINDHLQGEGTETDPYQIETLVGLQSMNYALQANFTLEADIDASKTEIWYVGFGFRPVGRIGYSFLGSLDGKGHEIADLYINRPDENYVGLFGHVHDVTIENLRVTGSISGDRWVGGVVGYIVSGPTTINRTVTNVAVTGDNRVGGLVGVMHNGNRIYDCAAHGPVNGPSTSNIGGLVGRIHQMDVIIISSYATGHVNNGDPGDEVGGLVGFKDVDSEVLNSFWDMDTSGQMDSAGGTGKTTAEMQNAETFTNTDTVGLDTPWDIEIIATADLINDYPGLNWDHGFPVWFIEQNAYAATFEINVDDITAGEQPSIEIFNAENQFGDPLVGDVETSIEIDGDIQDVTLSFVNGEANHIWNQITDAGAYTAEVTIDGITETDGFNVNPASVFAVSISPVDDQTTVAAGEDLMFTAEARDEYGNLITDGVTEFNWDNAVDGVFNKETVGDYDVTASYDGVTSDPITITVVPGDPDYIEISPPSSIINAGDTETYIAVAFDEFGNEIGDVTADTDWSIEAGAGGSWSANVYTSENFGTWTVTGTYDTLTDTAELTVMEDGTLFTLTITAMDGGTTNPLPGTYNYLEDQAVTVEAVPNSGWIFSHWTGDYPAGESGELSIDIVMDADKTLTAHFVDEDTPMYTLTIEVEGGGTTTPAPGTHNYVEGSTVTVQANPDTGWAFSHWTGDYPAGQSEESTIVMVMDANKTLTAHFEEVTDIIGPTVEITSPVDGTTLDADFVTVQWTSQEGTYPIIHYEVRLNSGPWVGVGTTLQHTFEDLADGDYTVTVRVTDEHDNQDSDSVSFTVDVTDEEVPPDDEEPTSFMDYWWVLLLLLLLTVVIVIIVLLMKRGKKKEPVSQPMQPYGEQPPAEEPFGPDEPVDIQPPEGQFQDEHVSPEQPPVDGPGEAETPPPPPEY